MTGVKDKVSVGRSKIDAAMELLQLHVEQYGISVSHPDQNDLQYLFAKYYATVEYCSNNNLENFVHEDIRTLLKL